MDIGANEITNVIVASTTSYIAAYSSVFLMVGGLVLALGVMGGLIDYFFGERAPYVMDRNGYSSTEFMLTRSDLNARDRKYYKSKYYPGSPKFRGKTLTRDDDE